ALEASERGLELDPEDDTCVNFRAMALTKLGRKKEADETIQAALKRDPENSYSQANLGWQLLEKGEPEKAMLHFQEALRIDPENEWARDGIIHALKARYFIYGLFMKYIFFMARLTSGVQVGIVIGGYFLIRTLLGFARENQEHMIWILPIVIAYVAFALLTWTADSVFNLALRMNKYGKLALPPQQVFESNIFASFLFPGLIFIGLWIAGISDRDLLSCALVCGLMLIPLSATFKSNKGWPKKVMAGYTTLMGVIGIIIICSSVFEVDAGRKLIGLFFLFAFVSQFVGNAAMMIRPKR
ncbi:tetratricopeptide repeat protein, partial [bacterium]|nr:tetratricopeptide repeat protein [bacterium]